MGGYAWMPQGTPGEVGTPGPNEQHELAGARDVTTSAAPHALGPRPTNAWRRELVQRLDAAAAAPYAQRRPGVVAHDTSHQAQAVAPW
jgi:hypothetical protein